ncbi:urease accessory protein UreD [Umbelopsis sp. PMI_123]|nr:urease accessory protein UreD [Umbelopsis sp. PMI_123]
MSVLAQATHHSSPGKGSIVCHNYGSKTKFSRITAQYPLKFVPSNGHHEKIAVAHMLSSGTSSGDHLDINVELQDHSNLLLLTRGSNKRSTCTSAPPLSPPIDATEENDMDIENFSLKGSSQTIKATLTPTSTLVVLPSATYFRDASHFSHQSYYLQSNGRATSQLVLLDWRTAISRDDMWHSSQLDIYMDHFPIVRDNMLIADSLPGNDGPQCFATLIIIACPDADDSLQPGVTAIRALPNTNDPHLRWNIQPIPHGVLVRIAGASTDGVRDFVKSVCLKGHIESIIGHGLFDGILS